VAPATWPTIRENILENVKTTLQAIAAGSKFIQPYPTVSRDVKHPTEVGTTKFPALYISPPEEALAHRTWQKTRNELSLIVTGYIRADAGENSGQELEKLVHDVKIALNQDLTRGGYAENTLVGPMIRRTQGVAPEMAGIDIEVTVWYRHHREVA